MAAASRTMPTDTASGSDAATLIMVSLSFRFLSRPLRPALGVKTSVEDGSWCLELRRCSVQSVRAHFRTEVSVVCEAENNSRIFDVPSVAARPLGSTSVNVQIEIVGRPGLDPGTLGFEPECTDASVVV